MVPILSLHCRCDNYYQCQVRLSNKLSLRRSRPWDNQKKLAVVMCQIFPMKNEDFTITLLCKGGNMSGGSFQAASWRFIC